MVNEVRTLGLQQAAELLKMHPETLRQRVLSGEIPSAKPGRSWIFIEADLAEWLRSQYSSARQVAQEGGKLCPSINEVTRPIGGSKFPLQVAKQCREALGLPTDRKP